MKQRDHRELPEWLQREAELHRRACRCAIWRRVLVALGGFWLVLAAASWKIWSGQ